MYGISIIIIIQLFNSFNILYKYLLIIKFNPIHNEHIYQQMDQICSPFPKVYPIQTPYSACFSDIYLTFIPSSVWIILLGIELLVNSRKTQTSLPNALLAIQISQVILSFASLTVTLFLIDINLVSISSVLSYVSSLLLQIIWISTYQLTFKNNTFALTSMCFLKLFMLLLLPWTIARLILTLINLDSQLPLLLSIMSVFSNGLSIAFLVILCQVGRIQYEPLDSPQYHTFDKASFISKLFFYYQFKLLNLGRTRALENQDMEPPRIQETAAYQKEHLLPYYNRYIHNKNDKYPLMKLIIMRYKNEIITQVLIGAVQTMISFTAPIYILMLEEYLLGDDPEWRGYAIVTYMFISRLMQTILDAQFGLRARLMNAHVRNGLGSLIYDKSLKTSSSALQGNEQFTFAQIVNLMQLDVEKIVGSIPFTLKIIYVPFQMSIGLYLLFRTIRWQGCISSLIVMVLIFIVNGVMARCMTRVRKVLMTKRDSRMKTCTQLLTNIRVLKLYNWEKKLESRVKIARVEELGQLVQFMKYMLGLQVFNTGGYYYIIISFLLALTVSGYNLTPGEVFAGIAVVMIVNSTIRLAPDIINNFVNMLVSLKRVQDYLQLPEYTNYIDRERKGDDAVSGHMASFSWTPQTFDPDGELQETKLILKNLTFTIKRGELVAVVGRVGSGKSSFLHAMIQNMEFVKTDEQSSLCLHGSTAYVSQESWIQNATIKDNILFGKEFDEKRYNEVIQVCQLDSDLAIMPGGDQAEIGERGINLSGGQKTRVALARAVYSNHSVFLLDDPLSAVDTHVGRAIFQNCFMDYLRGKTRILVTNNQQVLTSVDRIIVFDEGQIVEEGTYEELISIDGYFATEFIVQAPTLERAETSEEPEEITNEVKKQNVKIMSEEDRAYGRVSKSIFLLYFKALGGPLFLVAIAMTLTALQGSKMYTDLYLGGWTDQSESEQQDNRMRNFIIYVGGVMIILIIIALRMLVMFSRGIAAARNIFLEMLKALRKAPINKYYDVTPIGRILNRLSKDQSSIEGELMYQVSAGTRIFFNLGMSFILFCYIVPFAIIGVPFALYFANKIREFYISSAREITRLLSLKNSSILHQFSESLNGVITIRAFGYKQQFIDKFAKVYDERVAIQFNNMSTTFWLMLYMDLVSIIFLIFITYILVGTRGWVNAGYAGVLLSYSGSLSETIRSFIYSISFLQNSMIAYERATTLTQIVTEAPTKRQKDNQLKHWPSQGQVEFVDYCMKYRDDTPMVLKGLNGVINSQEKIGIVGRTGSGKSSICQALFRIVEAYSGSILIDGVNIADVGLDILRKNICVIPQEPTLFLGSMRDNIDPFNEKTNEELIKALQLVELFANEDLEAFLDKPVQEKGSNFSMGQRQLICIVRAIVKDTKIMFLDEATASVDYKTDEVIQNIIRNRFKDKTVLTIAHRLNTVMDYDRIMVMDDGLIAEFGEPQTLIEKKGLFHKLVKKGGKIHKQFRQS